MSILNRCARPTCDLVSHRVHLVRQSLNVEWKRVELPGRRKQGRTVKWYKKISKDGPRWCLAHCWWVTDGGIRKGVRLREGGVRGGTGVCVPVCVWWPVLVPSSLLPSQPSRLSSQPVSGSLPPLPADFSLGGREKNCPLSLSPSPTGAARARPCPPDINQSTHTGRLLQGYILPPPSELLWQTGWWAAVPPLNPHLQMRHPSLYIMRDGQDIKVLFSFYGL